MCNLRHKPTTSISLDADIIYVMTSFDITLCAVCLRAVRVGSHGSLSYVYFSSIGTHRTGSDVSTLTDQRGQDRTLLVCVRHSLDQAICELKQDDPPITLCVGSAHLDCHGRARPRV